MSEWWIGYERYVVLGRVRKVDKSCKPERNFEQHEWEQVLWALYLITYLSRYTDFLFWFFFDWFLFSNSMAGYRR